MTDIGIVGTGALLSGIVKCLLADGHNVSVSTDQARHDVEPLLARGATEQPTVTSLLGGSDTIISWTGTASDTLIAHRAIAEHLGAGQLWIDLTALDPATARDLARNIESRGGIYADAPVNGTSQQAERGELTSLVGCRRERFNRIKRVVGSYSNYVQRFGDPGAGLTARLLNSFVAQGTATLLAEAFETARHNHIDWRALHDVMSAGPAHSAMLEEIVAVTLDGIRKSQPSVASARRDVNDYRDLIRQLSGNSSCLADAVFAKLDNACSVGRGERPISNLLAAADNDGNKST